MKSIGDMNRHMIQMTKQYENDGRCDYNLTLINYMEPTSHTRIGFKDEANYGTCERECDYYYAVKYINSSPLIITRAHDGT
jgi:hypothetical protein